MKAAKETVRKYYKYTETAWTQPVLMADGTLGGSDYAAGGGSGDATRLAYYAFDGNASTQASADSASEARASLTFYSPEALKITEIEIIQDASAQIKTGTVYGSTDGTTWTSLYTIDTTGSETYTIDLSSNTNFYNYYRIRVLTSTLYASYFYFWYPIQVNMTGTWIAPVESTSSDYDYYRDEDEYTLPQKTERNYYKYVYEPFVQPVLTANGVAGGSNFAAFATSEFSTAYQAWHAFDGEKGSSSTPWIGNGTNVGLGCYNPNPLTVSGIYITNNYNVPTAGSVQTSTDGVTWTDVQSFTNSTTTVGATWYIELSTPITNVQYIRLFITSPSTPRVAEMELNATERTVTEGTSSDYDFYKDIDKYYAMNF